MIVTRRLFTNGAYGTRRVKPAVLACLHITGNRRVIEGYPDGINRGETAYQEWKYASRAGSTGPSAHLYVARKGDIIEAIDPTFRYAWSNGDMDDPDTSNAGIRAALAMRAVGYNLNEAYDTEVEMVGYPGSYPPTAEQIEAVAQYLAKRSKARDIPANVNTIHGHWQINGVDRVNCPTKPADRDRVIGGIIRRTQAILMPGMEGEAEPVQSFTINKRPDGSFITGRLTVKTDEPHYYLRLRDGVTVGPVGPGFGSRAAMRVRLLEPFGKGAIGEDRRSGYLVGDEAAFFLVKDVDFTPDPEAGDISTVVTQAVDAEKLRARTIRDQASDTLDLI